MQIGGEEVRRAGNSGLGTSLEWCARDGFAPVTVSSLRVNTVTVFDLYIQERPECPFVLYRQRNLPFSEAAKERLTENNVTQAYVRSDQLKDYRVYVEANLGMILDDPDIPIGEKSDILYGSARDLVKDVLDDPRSGGLFQRCTELSQHTAEFILGQAGAFENLLKVTSYDYYTYTHSVNVCMFSIALAQHLGYDPMKTLQLGNGALLHDVGKSLIDPAILNCPGKLSDDQWRIMKLHPTYGYNLLKRQLYRDDVVLDVVLHHHEKLNGKGYPNSLRDAAVSLHARISAVADIFDALTTRRPYKDAMPFRRALDLMNSQMAPELDGDVFNKFKNLMTNSISVPDTSKVGAVGDGVVRSQEVQGRKS